MEAYEAQPAFRTDSCCSYLRVRFLNVCAWGHKYPMFSIKYSRQLVAAVTIASLSCTAIQAESNELFGVIIKLIFVKTFRKFHRHCCRRFSRDVQLQRLRDGTRHLLVINLMRAAIRRGGCHGGHSWMCKSNVHVVCRASCEKRMLLSITIFFL